MAWVSKHPIYHPKFFKFDRITLPLVSPLLSPGRLRFQLRLRNMDLNRLKGSPERRFFHGLTRSMLTSLSSCSRQERHICSRTMDASRTGHIYIQSHLDNPGRILETTGTIPVPNLFGDAFHLLLSAHSHLSNPLQTKRPDVLYTIGQRRHTRQPDLTPIDNHSLGSMRASKSPSCRKFPIWILCVRYVGRQDRSQVPTKDYVPMFLQA